MMVPAPLPPLKFIWARMDTDLTDLLVNLYLPTMKQRDELPCSHCVLAALPSDTRYGGHMHQAHGMATAGGGGRRGAGVRKSAHSL